MAATFCLFFVLCNYYDYNCSVLVRIIIMIVAITKMMRLVFITTRTILVAVVAIHT